MSGEYISEPKWKERSNGIEDFSFCLDKIIVLGIMYFLLFFTKSNKWVIFIYLKTSYLCTLLLYMLNFYTH